MIIERLSREHRNIEKLLAILEQELRVFDRGDRPDYEVIGAIISYFELYPEVYHHPQEDVVFAKLKIRDPNAAAKVGDLAREHQKGAERLHRVAHAVDSVLAGREILRQVEDECGTIAGAIALRVQRFGAHRGLEMHKPGDVAPRVGKAADEAASNGIPDQHEDDRYRGRFPLQFRNAGVSDQNDHVGGRRHHFSRVSLPLLDITFSKKVDADVSPSIHPRSLTRCLNVSTHVSDFASSARPVNTPTRRIRPDCWARAASGHETADPAIAFIKSRRACVASKVRTTTDRLGSI